MLEERTWVEVTTPNASGRCLIGVDNEEFRQAVLERLENLDKFPTVLGVIFFQNIDMLSSHLGESSIMPYGPDNSIKDIEAVVADPMKFFLHDLPSMRQYPQWYISRQRHLAMKYPAQVVTQTLSREESEENYRWMAQQADNTNG